MQQTLEDVTALQLVGGHWVKVQSGTLRAGVTEILGERMPTLLFTDVDGREQVVPRSAVVAFDGTLVTPPDPNFVAAQARRAEAARLLKRGLVAVQCAGGTAYFQPGSVLGDRDRALHVALVDAVIAGRATADQLLNVVQQLIVQIDVDGEFQFHDGDGWSEWQQRSGLVAGHNSQTPAATRFLAIQRHFMSTSFAPTLRTVLSTNAPNGA